MESNDTASGEETWQDVTEEFMNSVKHLELGELLNCDRFTLLEAMSAIELMDHRMDGSMMLINCNRRILTFEQSIKSGLVKISKLELVEIISIMDDSYSCLTSWLDGYHLAQTVMINLYLHEPERIEDRCLRAFSQAMLKMVDFIESIVLTIPCLEEEDFYSHNDKFNLGTQFNDQKVLNSIEDVTHHYEKMLIETSNQVDACEKQSQNTSSSQNVYQKSHLIAIIDRLKFTSNFYACLYNLARNIARDLPSNIQPSQYQKYSKLVQNSVSNCDQHLEKCLDYLDRWMKSIDVGINPERTNGSQTSEGDFPTVMGFEPLLHYKLLSPGYPRCPSIRSRPSTVEYIKNLVIKMRQCLLASPNINQRSLKLSLETLEYLSRHSRPVSCVVTRSIAQILYLSNRSMLLLRDDVSQSLNEFCDPVIQSIKKDDAGTLDDLINQCTQVFSRIINLYGHNPARQHEKLPDIILSLKNLRFTAMTLNVQCNYNRIVHQWVMIQYNSLATKYVLMGFELELYSSHEYPYVFWFLHDILCLEEKFAIDSAISAISEYQNMIGSDNSKKAKGKKPRKRNQSYLGAFSRTIVTNNAIRLMTGGYFMLTHGLKLQGKIPSPSMKYTQEKIWFDHRFEIISPCSQYDMYKGIVDHLKNLDEIYLKAARYFESAGKIYEGLDGYDSYTKICRTNMIVARILATSLKSSQNRQVTFNFDTHPYFPIVKV